MNWFRLYPEARNDAKLRSLSDAEHRVWFNLLCYAAEQEERGSVQDLDLDLLALEVANGDLCLLDTTLQHLARLRIIEWDDDGLAFINWMKRQYDKPSDHPDKVNVRVKRYRERKAALVVDAPDAVAARPDDAPAEPEPAPTITEHLDPISFPVAHPVPVMSALQNGHKSAIALVQTLHDPGNTHVTPIVSDVTPCNALVTPHNRTDTEQTITDQIVAENNKTERERERRDLTLRARARASPELDKTNELNSEGGDADDTDLRWWHDMVAQRADREKLDPGVLLAYVSVADETLLWQNLPPDRQGVWRNWMLRALGFAVRDLKKQDQGGQRNARGQPLLGAGGHQAAPGRAPGETHQRNGTAVPPAGGPTGAAAVLAALRDPHSSVSRALAAHPGADRVPDVQRDRDGPPPDG